MPIVVSRTKRFGRVFYQGDAVPLTDRAERVKIGALPVEVNCDERCRCAPVLQTLENGGFYQGRVNVPRGFLAVDKDRVRAQVPDRIGARRKGKGADQNLVTWSHPRRDQAEMQSGSSRTKGNCVIRADNFG